MIEVPAYDASYPSDRVGLALGVTMGRSFDGKEATLTARDSIGETYEIREMPGTMLFTVVITDSAGNRVDVYTALEDGSYPTRLSIYVKPNSGTRRTETYARVVSSEPADGRHISRTTRKPLPMTPHQEIAGRLLFVAAYALAREAPTRRDRAFGE